MRAVRSVEIEFKRNVNVSCKVTGEELDRIVQDAKRRGLKVGRMIRDAVLGDLGGDSKDSNFLFPGATWPINRRSQ